ncbi:MAG: hypothetical protein FJ267_05905 [Planctomycetes bacterium]|nr:hypothetical protein [Planctomycetota bacterium]
MAIYENAYFRFRLDFPETRKLTSWRHGTISDSLRSVFQRKDDDLPIEETCQSKFLLTAVTNKSGSEVVIDSDVELSVFRLKGNEKFRSTLISNFEQQRGHYAANGIAQLITSEGRWSLGGIDFTYIDKESKSRSGHSRYRFFFRQFDDVFWLYGKIVGHNEQAFYDAIAIVEQLQPFADATDIPRSNQ